MQQLLRQDSVGRLIAAARRRMKQVVGGRVRAHGLSAPQFWLLLGIAETPGTTLSGLAERLRVDVPTASRIVSSLSRRGLVRSKTDPRNRRRHSLAPTPRGRALAGRLAPVARELRARMVRGLTAAEQQSLKASLNRVIENLDRMGRGGEEETA
jgi:DNA-binding MarR family transcriptional regulator